MKLLTLRPRQKLLPMTTTTAVTIEIAFILGAVLLLGLPTLIYPFGKDQGEYAYIASAFLRGQVIYKDVFNVKPPMTHLLHAVAILLFGPHMSAIRIFDWLWQGTTAWVIWRIAGLLYPQRSIRTLAALFYGITYFATDFWHSAQTDGFINLPIASSVLFFLLAGQQKKQWLWTAVGFCVAIATLLKYPIGLMLPCLLLLLWLTEREFWKPALWIVMGFSIPVLWFLFFAWARGALPYFLQIQTGYIPQYNAGFMEGSSYWAFTRDGIIHAWQSELRIRWYAVLLLLELVTLAAFIRPIRHKQWVVPLWAISAFLHVVIQNKYYFYHYLPMLAPQALIVGHLLGRFYEWLNQRVPRLRPALLLTIVLLFVFVFIFDKSPYRHKEMGLHYQSIWHIVRGKESLKIYYGRDEFGAYGWPIFSSRANLEVADYLFLHTLPTDKIFIWAFEPEIYFLSQRQSASRFIYNFPLYGRFAWPEFRDTLLQELAAEPPAVILVAIGDSQPWLTGTEDDSRQAMRNFPAFHQFVRDHYERVTQIAQFRVYQRKP